jgi:hypothetical protein
VSVSFSGLRVLISGLCINFAFFRMSRKYVLRCLLVLNSFSGLLTAQEKTAGEWKLRKSGNGISVYTRSSPTSSIDDLKIVSTLEGSLSAISAVLMDANNFPNWIYMCEEGKIIERISPVEQYQYQRLDAPYPVSDRDVVIHFTIRQDPQTKVIYTRSLAVSNYLPQKKGAVRLPVFDGGYELLPLGNGKVQVTYTLKMEPGGSIPGWLVNLTVVTGPYESTLKLQDEVNRPEYKNIKLPFIVEP